MIRSLMILAAVTLPLSGCATKPYSCPLNASGNCQNMQEIYDVARKAPRNTSRQNVMETAGRAAPALPPAHNPNAYAEPGERGQPIFKQPRVHRVWLAPYVDANGNLRSGEYTYFSTPGEWNYGTTREAGAAAAATFGPQHPDQLGFTPVEKSKKAPPKPGDLPAPTGVTTTDGITQPGQTLTQ